MKIGISGIHGIGKTTDVKQISEQFGLKILNEQARHFLDTEFPFEEVNTNLAVFMDFQNEVLNNQIKLLEENKDEDFITDRTPVDSLAYVVERLGAERYTHFSYFEDYFNRTFDIMKKIEFDRVFFINFYAKDTTFWKNKQDGQRNLSVMYMKSLNEIMLSLYSYFYMNKKVFKIPSYKTSNQRFEIIKKEIE